MRFGVFYEQQLPRPWQDGDEERLFHEALEQVALADRLGFDNAWVVEHHFLEEYSHSSAPEVFLAAAAARTERIRLGHGIRHTPAGFNHPARTAEVVSTLDVISHGRIEFGIGESATRLELGGFRVPAKEKRAMSLEAGEQVANMMAMAPYPGYEGKSFSMPCRNVVPKPVQKPHPPMWIACTNRSTIELAARAGLGALAFSFVDPDDAKFWVDMYYDIIRSHECVPIGHSVNPNIALVTSFSIHEDRGQAIRLGLEGFEFFRYALNALVAHDTKPGHSNLWNDFQGERGDVTDEIVRKSIAMGDEYSSAIGTPDDARRHLRRLAAAGVDQIIFIQQAGRNRHDDICASMELFAREVMPEFHALEAEARRSKTDALQPAIDAALARKQWMQPLAEDQVPIVHASVAQAVVPEDRS